VGTLAASACPDGAVLLVDSAPTICVLEENPKFAAPLRASLRLRVADAVQVASAIAVNADALVTHDRDFARVPTLSVLR
jgi:predicted nucleic acid-binding protein